MLRREPACLDKYPRLHLVARMIVLAVFGLAAGVTAGPNPIALSGSVALWSMTSLRNAAECTTRESHRFWFFLRGEVARQMFEHLRAEDRAESWGSVRKEVGGVVCARSKVGEQFRYDCSFALRIPQATLVPLSEW